MALDTIPKQEGGKLKAVASGTLPNGKPVVVNADGTVSVVDATAGPPGLGSSVVFNAADIYFTASAFDSNSNKVVIAYRDDGNSRKGTAVVGTVSGDSITFGSDVVFDPSTEARPFSVVFDSSSNKVVISFIVPDTNGSSIVGTVSGNSISFGSSTTFTTNTIISLDATFDSNSNKVVIVYRDENNSNRGRAVVGTVSGTSISFGGSSNFTTNTATFVAVTFDSSNNKVVAAIRDGSNSNYGTAFVGTVSGTSISFGTGVVFESATTNYPKAAFDTNLNKVLISYSDGGNSNYGTAIVGTVSGTSISFGTAAVFETGGVEHLSSAYDSTNQKFVISYDDGGNSGYGTYVVGTISGTSISFGTPAVFNSASTSYTTTVFDSNSNKIVISYKNGSDSDGYSVVFSFASTNLTSENYIGMSGGAIEVESGTQAIGSPAVFESASSVEIGSAYDANAQRVVVAYRDGGNSNYGTAVVGTVSGTSISFGTPVVFQSAVARYSSVAYDANAQKIVIAFKNDSTNASTAIVGTVSGTTISFGTDVVFGTASSNAFAATYDTNAQKVVIAYMTTNDNGIAIVGTVSGTSISFGSPTQLENSRNSELSIAYESSAQKVVVAYRDLENSNHGTSVVGTVSGTSISFGTPSVFSASNTYDTSIAYDVNAGKMVISYVDGGNSNYGTAIVGTVSGTSISFGSAVVFESGGTVSNNSIVYDPTAKRVVNFYRGGSSAVGNVVVGNVSGTSISFNTPSQFESGAANDNSAVYDSNTQKVVVAYEDGGNSGYGTSVVFQTGYTNINRGQVASGGNATVDIVGTVSTNQLSLTAGQQYYVQTDGTLGLTAASPSVLAGTAISATKMLVKT